MSTKKTKNERTEIKLVSILAWVSNVVTISMFIVGIIGWVSKYLQNNMSKWPIVLIVVSVLLIVLSNILFSAIKNSHELQRHMLSFFMRFTAQSLTYKICEKTQIYTCLTNSSKTDLPVKQPVYIMKYSVSEKIKVTEGILDSITMRYCWSGDEKITPKPLDNKDSLKLLENEFGFDRCKIIFRRSHGKNDDPFETGIKFDEMRSSIAPTPILVSNINNPTNLLSMNVVLPLLAKPTNIEGREYIHTSDENHWFCCSLEFKDNLATQECTINWTINNPIYGGKYMISWDCEEI